MFDLIQADGMKMEVLQKTCRKLRAEVRFEAQAVESIFFYSLFTKEMEKGKR